MIDFKDCKEIRFNYSNVSIRFFRKHKDIKEQFEKNILSYAKGNDNIKITVYKSKKGFHKIRIQKYRVLFTVRKGIVSFIDVIDVGSRSQIYKNVKKNKK